MSKQKDRSDSGGQSPGIAYPLDGPGKRGRALVTPGTTPCVGGYPYMTSASVRAADLPGGQRCDCTELDTRSAFRWLASRFSSRLPASARLRNLIGPDYRPMNLSAMRCLRSAGSGGTASGCARTDCGPGGRPCATIGTRTSGARRAMGVAESVRARICSGCGGAATMEVGISFLAAGCGSRVNDSTEPGTSGSLARGTGSGHTDPVPGSRRSSSLVGPVT